MVFGKNYSGHYALEHPKQRKVKARLVGVVFVLDAVAFLCHPAWVISYDVTVCGKMPLDCPYYNIHHHLQYIPFCLVCTRERHSYFKEWMNLFDWLGLLLILFIIPLRYTDSKAQWMVASLAFLFNFLRIFKFSCVTR